MMKIQTINLIKSKLLFPILGMFVGILFSLCEAIVAYSDTASPSEPIKEIFFNTISNNFFNKKYISLYIYGYRSWITIKSYNKYIQ